MEAPTKKPRLTPGVSLSALLRSATPDETGAILIHLDPSSSVRVDGPVLVSRDIELSSGRSAGCELVFTSDCRISTAHGATLSCSSLSLRARPPRQSATVSIDGSLRLRHCRMIGLNVIVSGAASDINLAHCIVQGNAAEEETGSPLLEVNDGKVEMEKTELRGSQSGIRLRGGQFRGTGCTFAVSSSVLKVYGYAKGELVGCRVEDCGAIGRVEGPGAKVRLCKCQVKRSGGVVVEAEGSAEFDQCFFGESRNCCVECVSGFVRLRACTFFRNGLSVQWGPHGAAEVEYCTFYNSQVCPISPGTNASDRAQISSNNFIESAQICQKLDKLAPALQGSFYGASDYERRIYLDVLLQRLKRSYMLRLHASGSDIADRLKQSVVTCLKLLPELPKVLLQALLEEPLLGVYLATGSPPVDGMRIEDVLRSWPRFRTPELFDKAVAALDKAEADGNVDWRLHEEWKTKLKELQLRRFGDAKHYKRKDYLIYMAGTDPLGCWYFLRDETSENLRRDVLLTLLLKLPLSSAGPRWISQWAQSFLASSQLSATSPPPPSSPLLTTWYQFLLDRQTVKCAKVLLDSLATSHSPSIAPAEVSLLRFEAEALMCPPPIIPQLNATHAAIAKACASFQGHGPLPACLRRRYTRTSPNAATAEQCLRELSLFFVSWRAADCLNDKTNTVIAVLAQLFFPDSIECPDNLKLSTDSRDNRTSLRKCALCLAPPDRPWLEMKVSACKEHHYFCAKCLRRSVSTSGNLWGKCPAAGCEAMVSRRDLELAGVERELVESILRSKVTQALRRLDGWRSCSVTACMGGKADVESAVFVCVLCKALVSAHPQDTDPVIQMKLLQGIGPSTAVRGEGVYRECYHCAAVFEKGDSCSSMRCGFCQQEFNLTFGPDKLNQHFFEESGISGQRYVPKKDGFLWKLGVFQGLQHGQVMSESQAESVYAKAKVLLTEQFNSVSQ